MAAGKRVQVLERPLQSVCAAVSDFYRAAVLQVSCMQVQVLFRSFDPFCASAFILQADRKDPQGNGYITGFEVLLQKQLKSKQMQKEMAEFVRER